MALIRLGIVFDAKEKIDDMDLTISEKKELVYQIVEEVSPDRKHLVEGIMKL